MTTYRQYQAALKAKSNGTTATRARSAKPKGDAPKKPYYARKGWNDKTAEERKEERKNKIKAAHELLTQSMESLETKEAYKDFLRFLGQFHQYSFKNCLLLKFQQMQRKQGASGFFSFKAWQEKGRHVKKGEKAYQVFAPCWINSKQMKTVTNPDTGEEEETNIPKWYGIYTLVPVFSYEQTEGEPLEFSNPWTLKGNGKTYRDLFNRLASVSAVPVTVDPNWKSEAGCKGVYSQNRLTGEEGITLNSAADDAEKLAVLIHEITHSICDKIGNAHSSDSDQIKEIRADSTAFVVCNALGIDTQKLNLIYLENWSRGDHKLIEKLGTEVQQAAHLILSAIETGEKIDRDSWREYIREERKRQRAEAKAKATETAPTAEKPQEDPETAPEATAANALPITAPEATKTAQDAPRTRSFFSDTEPETETETAQDAPQEADTETAEETPRRFSPLIRLDEGNGEYELASFDRETGEKVSILTATHTEELEEVPF